MASSVTALTTSADRERDLGDTRRRAIRSDRTLRRIIAGFVVWLIGFGVALGTTEHSQLGRAVVQGGVFLVPIVGVVVLAWRAARRATDRNRRFWACVCAFSALWLADGIVLLGAAAAGRFPLWAVWLATVLNLGFYVPASMGALFIGGRPSLPNGIRGLFDVTVVALATCYLVWEYTLVPVLARHGSPHLLIDAIDPVLDGILFVIALSVGIGARRSVPLPRLLMTLAVGVLAVLDALFSHLVDVEGSDGHWLLLGWECEAALICVAAVIAMRHGEQEGSPRTLPSPYLIIAVVVASLEALQVVGSHVLVHPASPSDVIVVVLVVLASVVRGILGNLELRRAAVGLDHARAEQERLAVTDPLTGLYNRRFFEEFLSLEADRSLRHGFPLSLIVADLDHFKLVNDEFGHPAGDGVLIEAARRLRGAVRGSDVLARYGGEEFAVVLPETDPATALEIAERCRRVLVDHPVELVESRSRSGHREVAITGSFGLATLWSIENATVDDLVRAADRALYRAKSAGRNRVSPAGEWDYLDLDSQNGQNGQDSPAGQTPAPDPVEAALLQAAELVDADQGPDEHGGAMARWAGVLCDALGLDAPTRGRCVLAARLHDIGKLAIPRSVLGKAGSLTAEEWALMRTHPEHSESLVALSSSVVGLGPVVRGHHERFDGTGYPDRLGGTDIPVESRIIAICDSWAAMRADRVYAPARSIPECRRELDQGRGGQFDPEIVDVFLALQVSGLVGELDRAGWTAPELIHGA